MNSRIVGLILLLAFLTCSAVLAARTKLKTSSFHLPAGNSDESMSRSPSQAGVPAPPSSQAQYLKTGAVAANQQPASAPKHIVYDILFREMTAFKKSAEEKERNGQNAAFLRTHHKEKLKLNDRQFEALDRIASDSNSRVEKLDQQAAKIIRAVRDQYPNGRLKTGQPVPEPPVKLKELQVQRDEARLYARDRLRDALGNSEFKRIDDFLQADIEGKLRPVGEIHRGSKGRN